jgi:hypothetical protein
LEPPEHEIKIADVPDSSPWSDAVVDAVHARLLDVDSHGLFHPEAVVSRQEAACAMVRAWESGFGRKLPASPVVVADDSDASPADRPAIYAAIRAGWLPLAAGQFRATQAITRAETAVAIYRMLGLPW